MNDRTKIIITLAFVTFFTASSRPAIAQDNKEYMKMIMGSFYPDYYHSKNPDVAPVYGNTPEGAFNHWKNHGIAELRTPNPFFNPKYYKEHYTDLNHMDGNQLLHHWVRHGILEGRAGNEFFDIKYYVNHHKDLKEGYKTNYSDAFEHWVLFGNNELRITAPERMLHLSITKEGQTNKIFAATVSKGEDPDLFRPDRTTGGKIGFGAGLLVGVYVGDPQTGAVAGALLGHGLDRVCTHVSNDITGPIWKQVEQGIVGKNLGRAANDVSDELKRFRKRVFGG